MLLTTYGAEILHVRIRGGPGRATSQGYPSPPTCPKLSPYPAHTFEPAAALDGRTEWVGFDFPNVARQRGVRLPCASVELIDLGAEGLRDWDRRVAGPAVDNHDLVRLDKPTQASRKVVRFVLDLDEHRQCHRARRRPVAGGLGVHGLGVLAWFCVMESPV